MNIICNNCGGADFYKLSKQKFSNPFMWSCIFADDMITLIKEYDNINFKKIELTRLNKLIVNQNNYEDYHEKFKICGLIIDNKFTVYYTHYLFGNYKQPYKQGPDILYYRNFELVYNKYNERLKRMSEKPTFIIIAFKRHGWNDSKIKKLLSLNTNYKVILITNEKCNTNNKNFHIIYDRNLDKTKKEPPILYIKKYFNKLKELMK